MIETTPAFDKDRLDHLAKLADDRWREYDSKSQAEWKFSYAIWGALLAVCAAVITQHQLLDAVNTAILIVVAVLFAATAVGVHAQFLMFIHSRLKALRIEMRTILGQRQTLLGLPVTAKERADGQEDDDQSDQGPPGRESMNIQWMITVMLALLLIIAAIVVKL